MAIDRRLRLLLQVAFVVAVFAWGGWILAAHWDEVRAATAGLRIRWGPVLLATALVFAAYALLIQLWRLVLVHWNARLGFVDAARIWSVSNLGRFVPLRVAQIGAMAYMARERGVSPVAATGSSVLNTLINIAAGAAVALAAGGRRLDVLYPGAALLTTLALVAAAVGLAALPWILPRVVAVAARLLRRPLPADVAMPASAVWLTALGNLVAWVLYGLAFQLFTAGVLGEAGGATAGYLAAYAASYIVGYLVIVAPGGLGAREISLAAAMVGLDLATLPEATLVALTSRLWLTVLEVVPGLLFLAHAAARRTSR